MAALFGFFLAVLEVSNGRSLSAFQLEFRKFFRLAIIAAKEKGCDKVDFTECLYGRRVILRCKWKRAVEARPRQCQYSE